MLRCSTCDNPLVQIVISYYKYVDVLKYTVEKGISITTHSSTYDKVFPVSGIIQNAEEKKEKGENASLLTLEQKLCPRSLLLLPWQFLLGSLSFILGTSSTPGWMDGGGEGRIIHSLGSNHGGEEEGGEENITIKKGRRKGAKK